MPAQSEDMVEKSTSEVEESIKKDVFDILAEGDWTRTSSNASETPLQHSADMRASSEEVAHPLP